MCVCVRSFGGCRRLKDEYYVWLGGRKRWCLFSTSSSVWKVFCVRFRTELLLHFANSRMNVYNTSRADDSSRPVWKYKFSARLSRPQCFLFSCRTLLFLHILYIRQAQVAKMPWRKGHVFIVSRIYLNLLCRTLCRSGSYQMNEHHIYIPNIPYVSLVSSLIQQHTNNADLYIRRVEQDLGPKLWPCSFGSSGMLWFIERSKRRSQRRRGLLKSGIVRWLGQFKYFLYDDNDGVCVSIDKSGYLSSSDSRNHLWI